MARLIATLERMATSRPRMFLAGIALLTRLPFVGRASPSVDETRSVQMAQRLDGARDVAVPFSFDAQAPLFPVLSVLQGAGGSDFDGRWLRVFPLLASIATVPLLYTLFRRWLRPGEALAGGLAAATSSFLIFYAKEARPYALAAFFFAAFLLAADRFAARENGWRSWLTLPALAAASVASHFAALATLGSFFAIQVFVSLRRRQGRALLRWIGLGAAVGIALLPLLIMLLNYVGAGGFGFVGWDTAHITVPAVLAEQVFFVFGNSLGSPDLAVLHLAVLALALPPVVSELRTRRVAGRPLPPVMALWWLPIAALAVLGTLSGSQLLYFPRAFLLSAPLLLLVWALGSLRWWRLGGPRRLVAGAGLGLYGMLGVLVATSSDLHPEYFGRSLVAEFRDGVATRLEDSDLVLVHHEILTSYIAYQWPGPQRVEGLGAAPMTASADRREKALRRQLRRLPANRRIVVILNGLATQDGLDQVTAEELGRLRRRVETLPCWRDDPEASDLLCTGIWVYGPVMPPDPEATPDAH